MANCKGHERGVSHFQRELNGPGLREAYNLCKVQYNMGKDGLWEWAGRISRTKV